MRCCNVGSGGSLFGPHAQTVCWMSLGGARDGRQKILVRPSAERDHGTALMSQQPAPSHNTLWYRTSTEGHRLFVQDPENTHAVYDPLHLRSCKKSDEELLQLLGHRRTRPLYRFYKQQNDLIDLLLAPIVPQESEDMPERQLFQVCLVCCRDIGATSCSQTTTV